MISKRARSGQPNLVAKVLEICLILGALGFQGEHDGLAMALHRVMLLAAD